MSDKISDDQGPPRALGGSPRARGDAAPSGREEGRWRALHAIVLGALALTVLLLVLFGWRYGGYAHRP